MFSFETRQAVTELAAAVLSVRPLVDVLEHPVRVTPGGHADLQPLLDRVTGRLGAPPFALTPSQDLGTFDRVVSERLRLAELHRPLSAVMADDLPDVDAVVDETAVAGFDSFCRWATVHGDDGVPVRAYAAGDPQAPTVVIASACGMPARLAEPWVRHLARRFLVLTWESRGLFGDVQEFDGATDVAAQARDLLAVMDHFGVPTAHLAGLCGGAVIALSAASQRPDRVSSLSLWHGDFELGEDAPKTGHQRNLQALMAMATQARVRAGGIHAVLCRSMLSSTPPDLAHLVLYPYATPELLFRYCQLNGAIMSTDARPQIARVTQPTLVVTSEDDATAHPDGSRHVAASLADARLMVAPHGDHLSLFQGGSQLLDVATRFIDCEDLDGISSDHLCAGVSDGGARPREVPA